MSNPILNERPAGEFHDRDLFTRIRNSLSNRVDSGASLPLVFKRAALFIAGLFMCMFCPPLGDRLLREALLDREITYFDDEGREVTSLTNSGPVRFEEGIEKWTPIKGILNTGMDAPVDQEFPLHYKSFDVHPNYTYTDPHSDKKIEGVVYLKASSEVDFSECLAAIFKGDDGEVSENVSTVLIERKEDETMPSEIKVGDKNYQLRQCTARDMIDRTGAPMVLRKNDKGSWNQYVAGNRQMNMTAKAALAFIQAEGLLYMYELDEQLNPVDSGDLNCDNEVTPPNGVSRRSGHEVYREMQEARARQSTQPSEEGPVNEETSLYQLDSLPPVGLRNQRFNCAYTTLIQALANSPRLKEFFSGSHFEGYLQEYAACQSSGQTMSEMNLNNLRALTNPGSTSDAQEEVGPELQAMLGNVASTGDAIQVEGRYLLTPYGENVVYIQLSERANLREAVPEALDYMTSRDSLIVERTRESAEHSLLVPLDAEVPLQISKHGKAYELTSCILHTILDSGVPHFTTLQRKADGVWYEINDTVIKEREPFEAQELMKQHGNCFIYEVLDATPTNLEPLLPTAPEENSSPPSRVKSWQQIALFTVAGLALCYLGGALA